MADQGERSLRLAHLYPTLMNLYGDRGNIYCLKGRCEARGIHLEIEELGLDAPLDPSRYDLIFMGGGQDREQARISDDLLTLKGQGIRAAVEKGMPVLTVCGGYQMMCRYYQGASGLRMPGLEIFDAATIHPGDEAPRCIGNIEVDWEGGDLVGFENHGGRTYLGPSAVPLGPVTAGFGNNGQDGTEGCRYRNAFGTYLHGSLLPKNPALADLLLQIALERRYGDGALAPIDDSLEMAAHESAAAIAQHDARRRRGLRLPDAFPRIGVSLRLGPRRGTGA
jgi:CobQ-like glutamine amidotransferase family enzyme